MSSGHELIPTVNEVSIMKDVPPSGERDQSKRRSLSSRAKDQKSFLCPWPHPAHLIHY